MASSAYASSTRVAAGGIMNSLFASIQWGLDRMVSVGYGVVYDYIF